jgi:hypothetical protein
MEFPKQQVLSLIESRLGGDQAQQAAQQLPDQVDHEQHGNLLQQFGLNPQELVDQFMGGGGQGGGGQGEMNQGYGIDPTQSSGGYGIDRGEGGGYGSDPGQGGGYGSDPGQGGGYGDDPGQGGGYGNDPGQGGGYGDDPGQGGGYGNDRERF